MDVCVSYVSGEGVVWASQSSRTFHVRGAEKAILLSGKIDQEAGWSLWEKCQPCDSCMLVLG